MRSSGSSISSSMPGAGATKQRDICYPVENGLQPVHGSMEESRKPRDKAKRVQVEFVYLRQKTNLLQQERDILRWHSGNHFKGLSLKRDECGTLLQRIADLQASIQKLRLEKGRATRLQASLSHQASKIEQENEELERERQAVVHDIEQWRARRAGFEAEITRERRETDEERRKRGSQYRLLQLAKNREKKIQARAHLLSTMELRARETQENFDAYKAYGYNKLALLRSCSDNM
ncbi:hypothetical protein TGPRC2_248445 [Toxoplasma gondii TgCatPRC2]|uniref:Uncharacterized protein n=9 Tax=Toxoplasma gondii TaxID=5811 RepID=A0A151HFQ0_TOXGO|nr:hypothetical protein TGDOM2_248445 [Toxoplasma gondii GAB2-2007-GAL-DOM2]KFG54084.1 hypothetical protein TGFOU_248445 [Toxoplasma gondii FOU]KFG64409.1 hypothetical protein TGRUB_248445 [Toxoplasma gondii RUB]KFH12207.1 hypothetical protein TGVAND_248445 [Toxoplasma gondii VAND]KFH16018.1 hypothetical protein TGMAS_248445 [Toxoplasma gondii MAS]KYF49692.1 hypothetical protein TGARI_248445 [Toxoplasma gondii ARI]KYK68192.1 hypothetical protein TGPRC2_248445 [Toxoplasma gondii TgCatPRC2]PIM